MKYALFEFVDEKSCEIGETRWIRREDASTFTNVGWDRQKEVMVAWPHEFAKVSKKIVKGSIDPMLVSTTTCVAKVIIFSDDYETIREHMTRFCATGSTDTPVHGRGQRATKKNGRYVESDEEWEDLQPEVTQEKAQKRRKKNLTRSSDSPSRITELEALKAKYNLTKQKDSNLSDESEDGDESTVSEDDVQHLKEKNHELQQQLKQKEKEVRQLHLVINNLKEMPSLPDLVTKLKKQVDRLSNTSGIHNHSVVGQESRPSSRQSSQGSSSNCTTDSDVESPEQLVALCPNVSITKSQQKVLKAKANLKDFVYAIMGMLWSREVLSTHSMTGKMSNAFKEKDAKPQLDQEKVNGICEYASKRYGCPVSEVRQVMMRRIGNIVKVENAKKKSCEKLN